jgi:hypothetical protein
MRAFSCGPFLLREQEIMPEFLFLSDTIVLGVGSFRVAARRRFRLDILLTWVNEPKVTH